MSARAQRIWRTTGSASLSRCTVIRGGDIRSRAMRLTPKSGWDAQRFWTPSTTRPVEPAALRLPADAGHVHPLLKPPRFTDGEEVADLVIVKKIYILAVQAKTQRHRLTIREDAWFLVNISLPAPTRLKVSLQPPPTFSCEIRQTATSLFRSLPTSP
ncbi:hypothetical protein D3C77_259760 [compost metagenome]